MNISIHYSEWDTVELTEKQLPGCGYFDLTFRKKDQVVHIITLYTRNPVHALDVAHVLAKGANVVLRNSPQEGRSLPPRTE